MVVEQGVCTAECPTTTTITSKCANGLSSGGGPLNPPNSSSTSPGSAPGGGASPGSPCPVTSSQAEHPQQPHHYYSHHRFSSSPVYNAEHARMEAWMDENPEFMQDYIIRKATRQVVDAWLVNHATPSSSSNDLLSSPTAHYASGFNAPMVTPVNGVAGGVGMMAPSANNCSSRGGSGATTPVR